MSKLITIALILLVAVFPELAFAEEIRPGKGTDWDLYVFGNAYVVKEIFEGITLLMTGEGSGFKTLLLFMATLGFLALAVGAGFDPSKNLMKMFTYIIVAWFVSYSSTTLTANVVITDTLVDKYTDYRLTGVPAIVVLPAALTSQVGVTFTKYIETYFGTVMPPSFTISGGGQFNLFNRMIQESSQYAFTNQQLKKTISAYTSNCVVPAIALKKFTGTDVNGKQVTGIDALTKSQNYVEALGTANMNAIMTPYYFEYNSENLGLVERALKGMSVVDGISLSGPDGREAATNGLMMSCASAYELMKADMEKNAQALLTANAEAWAKTGVQVPLEGVFKDMLARAAVGQTDTRGALSTPNGFILQQAALNTMSGSFREAALQTGNSEMMQATALAQAEQNQKSGWVAGFQVFNNMTGYVFTVLQVFIYALTPIIVVSMLIPGLGRTLVTNYLQILIWLTLWNPMLAIVNFIITLFGSSGFSAAITTHGLTMESKGLIVERANDLIIAAQFLGTMVPLLAWGIVKGAMAFTEFIQHGVGSAMAASAGAAAASGNLSMNNLGMDSVKMGDYSTRTSSAVGFQPVSAGAGAGSLDVAHDLGGTTTKVNSSPVNLSTQLSSSANQVLAQSKAISSAAQIARSETHSLSDSVSKMASTERGSSENIAHAKATSNALSVKLQEAGLSNTKAIANAVTDALNAGSGRATTDGYNAEAGGAAGFGPAKFGAKYSGGTNTTSNVGDTKGHSLGATDTLSATLSSLGLSEAEQRVVTDTVSRSLSHSASSSTKADHSESALMSRAYSETINEMQSYQDTASRALAVQESMSHNMPVDPATFQASLNEIERAKNNLASAGAIQGGFDSMSGTLKGQTSAFDSEFKGAQSAIQTRHAGLEGNAMQYAGKPGVTGNIEQKAAEVRAKVVEAGNTVDATHKAGKTSLEKQVRANNSAHLQSAGSVKGIR